MKVLSSQSRLEKIVADILFDMATRDRLMSGRGNAMLVCSSIYQACKTYELFSQTHLKGKCAIVTSYSPTTSDIKGEESGEGLTERMRKYDIYRRMLADYFDESEDAAVGKVEKFETAVKEQFVDEPGQMKLLIVVDKLLTGFDAPPATYLYLYIDKHMRDHDLFQAICRVNRLDGDDKEYGYIIDYKDLFNSLELTGQEWSLHMVGGQVMFPVVGNNYRRLITVTPTDIVHERRLAAVTHAIEIGNTSEAARRFGVSRQSLHRWKALFEAYGAEALVPKTRRVPQMPNAAPLCVIERLGRLAVTYPQGGARWYAGELSDDEFSISKSCVQTHLNRLGMGRRSERLAAARASGVVHYWAGRRRRDRRSETPRGPVRVLPLVAGAPDDGCNWTVST